MIWDCDCIMWKDENYMNQIKHGGMCGYNKAGLVSRRKQLL